MTTAFTIADAAQRLGISDHTVRRRIKAGELPARRDHTGRLWVTLADADTTAPASSATAPRAPDSAPDDQSSAVYRELVASLQRQIETQALELDARRREVQELHVLLQQAQRALPAAPAQQIDREEAQIEQPRRRWWQWRQESGR